MLLLIISIICLTGCFSGGSLIIDTQSYEKKLFVGDKIYLSTNQDSILPGKEVVWESSDENVVVVSNDGLVEAVGEGTATITAEVGDYSTVIIIHVTDLQKNYTFSIPLCIVMFSV